MKKLILLLPLFLVFACGDKNEDKEKKGDDGSEKDTTEAYVAPTPLLGNTVSMSYGTQNYDKMVEFYTLLGWKEVESYDMGGMRYGLFSDGSLMLSIMEDSITYMGPSYLAPDKNVLAELDKKDLFYFMESDSLRVIISPDSVGLGVMVMDAPAPDVKNVSAMFATKDKSLIEYPNPKIGTFQEFAVSVDDIEESIKYWESLGFKSSGIMEAMYPYTIMYDGLMIIGLHETGGMWYGTALTYSGESPENNAKTIAAVKEKGFDVQTMEMEGFDTSYLITDPDGNIVYLTADFKKSDKE